MTRLRIPKRLTQREIRNAMEFMGGGVEMEGPSKRGPQAENTTNEAIGHWRKLKPGLVLERNKRRLATPPGMNAPIMLGWLCDGSSDWIGYQSMTITPAMVGKRIAAFVAIEAKRPDAAPVLQDTQEKFLNALKDAGGIAGVARNAEEAELILQVWKERVCRR